MYRLVWFILEVWHTFQLRLSRQKNYGEVIGATTMARFDKNYESMLSLVGLWLALVVAFWAYKSNVEPNRNPTKCHVAHTPRRIVLTISQVINAV